MKNIRLIPQMRKMKTDLLKEGYNLSELVFKMNEESFKKIQLEHFGYILENTTTKPLFEGIPIEINDDVEQIYLMEK